MTDEVVAYLFAFALSMTGYSAPSVLPSIERASAAEIATLTGCTTGCPAALYTGDVIVVRDDLISRDRLTQALVVHELVHVLQRETLGVATTCAEATRQEREAYLVQSAFLSQHRAGSLRPGPIINNYRCTLDE